MADTESGARGAGLSEAQQERAFRHGFDARDRFADRPFDEVESWLRQSWEGAAPDAAWDRVKPIVRRGYENYKGAGLDEAADPAAEALEPRGLNEGERPRSR